MNKHAANTPRGLQPRSSLNPQLEAYRHHIESGRLYPVGVRRSVRSYLRETWGRRAFIWRDSQAKVRAQNNQHRLGSWWLVLKPLTDALFYWILFSLILKADRGVENYTGYIIVGILMFQFVSRALTQSASVMLQGKSMMRAFSFPRITVPLSLAVREMLSFIPVVVTMVIMLMVLPPHEGPEFTWPLFFPAFLLNILFNLGLSLLIARFAYVVPDIGQIMSIVTRFLLYGSGVLFPIDKFLDHPVVLGIIQANPIYIFLDLYREVILYGHAGTLYHWGSLTAWSVGLLLVGFFMFWRAEEVYGREFN
ncbi:ABC transporter permease [Rothia sp. LK2588]|uniref:ABC transporter permease n=1 Tax=Rothia sp. LK2588 TaxID=3114369 RepID=UPI0034CD262E